MEAILYDVVGIIGVGMILTAYFLLQRGTLGGHQLSYLFLNLIGSILITISLLLHTWNLPSFIIEVCWIVISLYGIFRTLRAKVTHTEKELGE